MALCFLGLDLTILCLIVISTHFVQLLMILSTIRSYV